MELFWTGGKREAIGCIKLVVREQFGVKPGSLNLDQHAVHRNLNIEPRHGGHSPTVTGCGDSLAAEEKGVVWRCFRHLHTAEPSCFPAAVPSMPSKEN